MTAVYPGCGTDVLPLLTLGSLDQIKRWVYLDSQPQSEFGHLYDPGFERPEFIPTFRRNVERLGFRESVQDSQHINFIHPTTRVEVSFWPSKALPLDSPPPLLVEELAACDHLVVCGHDPDKSILDMITPNPVFITDFKTVLVDPDPDGVIQHNERFSSFLLINPARDIKAKWWSWQYEPHHRGFMTTTRHETWEQLLTTRGYKTNRNGV